jgi:hypothetical protein
MRCSKQERRDLIKIYLYKKALEGYLTQEEREKYSTFLGTKLCLPSKLLSEIASASFDYVRKAMTALEEEGIETENKENWEGELEIRVSTPAKKGKVKIEPLLTFLNEKGVTLRRI